MYNKSSYALIKYPASAKHFTLAPIGRRALKLSQCRIEANPPAEHPDNIAYMRRIPLAATSEDDVCKRRERERERAYIFSILHSFY